MFPVTLREERKTGEAADLLIVSKESFVVGNTRRRKGNDCVARPSSPPIWRSGVTASGSGLCTPNHQRRLPAFARRQDRLCSLDSFLVGQSGPTTSDLLATRIRARRRGYRT
jgi:hypothetical protein